MPYISRIVVDRLRNIRDLEISLVPAEGSGRAFEHLILTGPNGSGKSSLLQAVAMLIEGERSYPTTRDGMALEWTPVGRLADQVSAGNFIAAWRSASFSFQLHDVSGPKRWEAKNPSLFPIHPLASSLLQYLVNQKTDQAFARVEGDLDADKRHEEWFDRFRQAVSRLVEDQGVGLEFERSNYDFRIRRSDGQVIGFREFSDGHATALNLLAEILLRVETAQITSGDRSRAPSGVVIVDEIETHLHLSLQEEILPLLTEFFPTIQFIIATHSPAVVSSIPGAIVCDLASRVIQRSDDLQGLRYGAIMKGQFGLEEDMDLDSAEKLHAWRTLVKKPTRTADEQKKMELLASELSSRSTSLATEVWMTTQGLSMSLPRFAP